MTTKQTDLRTALDELSKRATPGPWAAESEKSDGSYGSGEDTHEGYDTATIVTETEIRHGAAGVLFESHNSTVGSIREENDEDRFRAWDEVSEANAKFIVALVNAYRAGELTAAPKPTGTEAGRGVGAEDGWRSKAADEVEGIASLWEGDGRSYAMTIAAILRAEEPTELPPADAETKRIVARAWDRFQRGVAATPTPPTPDSTAQGDGTEAIVTAAERAYGTLWRHYGLAAGYAYDARKLLLGVIGKEGQRRGIAWSNEKYGPLGPDPRSMLSEEDQREMGL